MFKEYFLDLGEKISVFKSIDETLTDIYTLQLRKFNGDKLYLYYPYNKIGKKRVLNKAEKMKKNKDWRKLSEYLNVLQDVLTVTQKEIYDFRNKIKKEGKWFSEQLTDKEIAEMKVLYNRKELTNEQIFNHYLYKVVQRDERVENII